MLTHSLSAGALFAPAASHLTLIHAVQRLQEEAAALADAEEHGAVLDVISKLIDVRWYLDQAVEAVRLTPSEFQRARRAKASAYGHPSRNESLELTRVASAVQLAKLESFMAVAQRASTD